MKEKSVEPVEITPQNWW